MSIHRSALFKWAAAGTLVAGAIFAATSANAGVSWSVGVGLPGVAVGVAEPGYYEPAPVYTAPPPVYYQPPAPVYYRPAPPVYYEPAYRAEGRRFDRREWDHDHRGGRRDWDHERREHRRDWNERD